MKSRRIDYSESKGFAPDFLFICNPSKKSGIIPRMNDGMTHSIFTYTQIVKNNCR